MLSKILNLLFPSQCPICGASSDNHKHNPICHKCWISIERYEGPRCSICGLPTPSQYTGTCSECLKSGPPFSKILYYGVYEGALREAVHLLKFNGIKRLARPLSELLLTLPVKKCAAIIPVPLHPGKLKKREFNQTALLGLQLSRALKIPLLLDSLKKVRETRLQTEVSGKERHTNLTRAYAVSGDISGKRLLLVDDVITTGATVRECAATLKRAGASDIEVIALARSMPKY
jgi:competence protein ComFC